jgi:hypothetical protein
VIVRWSRAIPRSSAPTTAHPGSSVVVVVGGTVVVVVVVVVDVVVVTAVGCTSATGDFGPVPALHPASTRVKDPAPSHTRDGRTGPCLFRLRLVTGAILPPDLTAITSPGIT